MLSKNNGKPLSQFEKSLFLVVRWVVTALIVIGIVGIGVFVVNLATIEEQHFVSFEQVKSTIETMERPPEDGEPATPQVERPAIIDDYFEEGSQNYQVFEGWLSNLSAEEQESFLQNLAYIMREAEGQDEVDVIDAINTYQTLKFESYDTAGMFDEYATQGLVVANVAGIFSSLFIVVLLILVLVLLAIERNTRVAPQAPSVDSSKKSTSDESAQ